MVNAHEQPLPNPRQTGAASRGAVPGRGGGLYHPGTRPDADRAALDRDPTLRERNDDVGLRQRLRDAELLAERVALALAAGDTTPVREYADWTAPVYRRKRVPLDDLINLCEGLRAAFPLALAPSELPEADAALDAAIAQYRWHRRLAGDARKRNAFLQFIYKGG